METPAFHCLTPEGRTALLYMAKRYYGHNNGQIGFGVRSGGFVRAPGVPDAGVVDMPVLSKSRMHRALIELEALGFAVVTKESSFGQKKLTREWRLTWVPCSNIPATKDFMRHTMADCRRIQAAIKAKASPAGATKSAKLVPLAVQSSLIGAAIIPLQSRLQDYSQPPQSHARDTSSNHPMHVTGRGKGPRVAAPSRA
jgi:hypothetical protein